MEPGTFFPVNIAWGDAFARIGLSILFALSIGGRRHHRDFFVALTQVAPSDSNP